MNVNYYSKEELTFVEITNNSKLKVIFCNLGASVFQIYFNQELMTRNVKNVKDFYFPSCYYGKTIGRTANRIKGDTIKINDQEYKIENNEGPNTLHGGKSGFSNQKFDFHIDYYLDHIDVVFTYLSKDLESGYPGNVNVEVAYSIYRDDDEIRVRYKANSDQDTLLSLTNHAYFCLGDRDISNLYFKVDGHDYLDVHSNDLLPIERKASNDVMNFSEYKLIVKDIDNQMLKGKMLNGYDSYFYFDEIDINKPNVSLKNDRYQMDIYSDFEGVQLYSSNYLPPFALEGDLSFRDSVAVEPSDSFLNEHLLKKDDVYRREIRYKFLLVK